jgi:hypothetical protein
VVSDLAENEGGRSRRLSTAETSLAARWNDLYAWTGQGSGTTPSIANGINDLEPSGRCYWSTADERGSIMAMSNPDGTVAKINTYDEYGKPGSNGASFGYAGLVPIKVTMVPIVHPQRN